MRNFQILTVSAVKMCKQCLQTASPSGGFRPQAPYRRFAPEPQMPWAIALQMKILCATTAALKSAKLYTSHVWSLSGCYIYYLGTVEIVPLQSETSH